MPRRAKRYAGILARPMSMADPIGMLERLDALLGHYGIEKNQSDPWFSLVLHLAGAHVPGFQFAVPGPEKKNGRRIERHDDRLASIWWDIEMLRHKNRRSVSEACRVLARQEKWRGANGKVLSSETLRRIYEQDAETSGFVSLLRSVVEQVGFEKFVANGGKALMAAMPAIQLPRKEVVRKP